MKYLSLLIFLTLSSCSTSHTLTEEAQKIKIAHDKPKGCSVVGKYQGQHDKGSVDLARNMARNLAAKDNATHVTFDEEINNAQLWQVYATGYICQ